MFISLFLKECRQMLKCLTYYVIIACMVLFYVTQMSEMKIVEKPEPGQKDYGITYSSDEKVIMNNTVQFLVLEYVQNSYVTYPIGFYKTVRLNKEKQAKMEEIAIEVTGLSAKKLKTLVEEYLQTVTTYVNPDAITVTVDEKLNFERFQELMKQADKLLGGGSKYSKSFMKSNAIVPMTYEQALAEYNDIVEKDHLSGTYARLFCDYMGLMLGILPVFIAVTRGLRDRRARASEVIYSRKASSFHIVMSRYLAMLVMLLIPILLISIIPTVECLYFSASEGIAVDYFAFIKYILGWLLPTVMISLSVGVLLTEVTDTAIAIIIQGIWWFINLFMGAANMVGDYGWNMMPRHNSTGFYQVFHDNFHVLVTNRLTYEAIAVILALSAVMVYEMKRRGRLRIGKIHSNRNSESKV
ncbi:MAG TPA: ABC transporter permease [Mobilitalea sp.]|nr:ABC transporter permease [Mobilitalea sp.]